MITYQITSMTIGASLAATILFLVRRDRLHGPYAIWWIGTAATVALLGLFPRLFDVLALKMGVSYPPVLAIVLGFGLLLLKMLTMDLDRSRQERLIRRLAQRLAMLEAQENPSPIQPPLPPGATDDARSADATEPELAATPPPLPQRESDRE